MALDRRSGGMQSGIRSKVQPKSCQIGALESKTRKIGIILSYLVSVIHY